MINDLDNVDFIPSNVSSSHQEALLYVFEDNEAVIKMIIEGRSPTMDMSPEPTELLLIGSLTESIWNPKSKSNMLTPKTQLADILTKGSFSKNEWSRPLCLIKKLSFSMYSCSHFKSFPSKVREHIVIGAMSKRGQETTSNDGSRTAKARPVNLVMHS